MRPATTLLMTGTLVASFWLVPDISAAADSRDDDTYQIMKATQDRVWRLNKKTGEIAVCTLERDNLICTSSAKAITPPSRTYAERQRDQEKAAAEAQKRRDIEKAKDLEFLDRVIAAFRILIGAAIEHGNGSSN